MNETKQAVFSTARTGKAALVGFGIGMATAVLATLAATVLTLEREESVTVLGLATGTYQGEADGSFEFSIGSGPALIWFIALAPVAAVAWATISDKRRARTSND